MKKFVVLMLVLSMASLANAGLVTTILVPGFNAVVDTTAKTITFVGTATTIGDPLSVTSVSLSVLSPDAGSVAYVSTSAGLTLTGSGNVDNIGYAPGSWISYSAYSSNGAVGNLAVFSYTGSPTKVTLLDETIVGLANAEVGFYNGGGSAVSLNGKEIAFSAVPEPATMVLLGLGGLLLRRKK